AGYGATDAAQSARSVVRATGGKTRGARRHARSPVPVQTSRNNSFGFGSARRTTSWAIGSNRGVTFLSYASAMRLYSSTHTRVASFAFTDAPPRDLSR